MTMNKPTMPKQFQMPRFHVQLSVNRDEIIEAMTFEDATAQLWENVMNSGDYTIEGEELEESDNGISGISTAPDVLEYLSAIREGDTRADF